MLFANYDIDGDGIFSMEEGAHIMADLENDQLDRRVRKFWKKTYNFDVIYNWLKAFGKYKNSVRNYKFF